MLWNALFSTAQKASVSSTYSSNNYLISQLNKIRKKSQYKWIIMHAHESKAQNKTIMFRVHVQNTNPETSLSYTKVLSFEAVFREINALQWLEKATVLMQCLSEFTHGLDCNAATRQIDTRHDWRDLRNHRQNTQQTCIITSDCTCLLKSCHNTSYRTQVAVNSSTSQLVPKCIKLKYCRIKHSSVLQY